MLSAKDFAHPKKQNQNKMNPMAVKYRSSLVQLFVDLNVANHERSTARYCYVNFIPAVAWNGLIPIKPIMVIINFIDTSRWKIKEATRFHAKVCCFFEMW